jgi:hypothetical protein
MDGEILVATAVDSTTYWVVVSVDGVNWEFVDRYDSSGANLYGMAGGNSSFALVQNGKINLYG